MGKDYLGFRSVEIRMPNGARFFLDQEHPIRSEDVDLFLNWLNKGRTRVGLEEVKPKLLNLPLDLSLGRFNELAERGILPTDQIELAYGDTVTLVPRYK